MCGKSGTGTLSRRVSVEPAQDTAASNAVDPAPLDPEAALVLDGALVELPVDVLVDELVGTSVADVGAAEDSAGAAYGPR